MVPRRPLAGADRPASRPGGPSARGLLLLARRIGIRDRRGREADAELLARHCEVTERVRATFEALTTGG